MYIDFVQKMVYRLYHPLFGVLSLVSFPHCVLVPASISLMIFLAFGLVVFSVLLTMHRRPKVPNLSNKPSLLFYFLNG